MAVLMVSLNWTMSGEFVARKAIPKDARTEYKRHHGVSREAILKIPAGTPKAQAEAETRTDLSMLMGCVRGSC